MAESNILVTGFGPFGAHKVNASWEAVSALPDNMNGYKIIKEEIPVAYDYVEKNIPLMWQLYNPKLVVHVGVSSYTTKIQLETCAHSRGYEQKDVENKCPTNGVASCGVHDEKDCIKTNVCTKTICERLNEFPTLKATVSHNTGRYLCEFIYYTSLKINNSGTIFVHVPPIDKPFSKKELTYAIEEIIKCALHLIAKDEETCTDISARPATIYKNGRVAAAF